MWAFIAFVCSNILWFIVGVFVGGGLVGVKEVTEKNKEKEQKENDESEISST